MQLQVSETRESRSEGVRARASTVYTPVFVEDLQWTDWPEARAGLHAKYSVVAEIYADLRRSRRGPLTQDRTIVLSCGGTSRHAGGAEVIPRARE